MGILKQTNKQTLKFKNFCKFLLALICLLFGQNSVFADTYSPQLNWSFTNHPTQNPLLGLNYVKDVDGDGIRDIVFAVPVSPSTTYIYLVSGGKKDVNNQPLKIWEYLHFDVHGAYVTSIAVQDDLNNDPQHVQDILIGYKRGTWFGVMVLDGANGSLLGLGYNTSSSGVVPTNLKTVPDVNGDGKRDILLQVGSRIEMLNGVNLSVLWRYTSGEIRSLSSIEDLNGDGVSDVVASIRTTTEQLIVLSGRGNPNMTTTLLKSQQIQTGIAAPIKKTSGFGEDIIKLTLANGQMDRIEGGNGYGIQWGPAIQGTANKFQVLTGLDANGDSFNDIVLASDRYLKMINGADGNTIWANSSPLSQSFSNVVSIIKDTNDDGVDDVVAVKTNATPNIVYLLNGTDGSEIWQYTLPPVASEVAIGVYSKEAAAEVTGIHVAPDLGSSPIPDIFVTTDKGNVYAITPTKDVTPPRFHFGVSGSSINQSNESNDDAGGGSPTILIWDI